MPDHYEKKKKKSKNAVPAIKKALKGTGWGKITRLNDQERLNKLMKESFGN